VRSSLSTPLPLAQVMLVRGDQSQLTRMAQTKGMPPPLAMVIANAPSDDERAREHLAAGDLVVELTEVPDEPVSACAVALVDGLARRETSDKLRAHMDDLEVRCVPIASNAASVVVETPPQRRID